MGLFRSEPRQVRLGTTPVRVTSQSKVSQHWTDGLGVVATRALQLLIVGATVAALLWLNQSITVVTIPLLLALILACAVAPVMGWLRRKGVPSLLATIIVLLSVVAVLTGVVWLIVVTVRNQWEDLASQATKGFNQLVAWVQEQSANLPFNIDQDQIDSWLASLQEFVTSAQFGSGAIAGVSAVATFITSLVLLVVTLFFFLKDGPRMWEFMLRPFKGEQYERARRVGDKTVTTLGAYVRGTASVAAVDAIGITAGLLILQIPLAIPLGVLVFLLAFIPIVGATLAGILAALVALVSHGFIPALIVVAIVVGVNQLEGNLLQPVLMGRAMKLHSFVILIALTIGTVLGGIVGAIIAVPITAAAWGIINVWNGPDSPPAWAQIKPREKRLAEGKVD